MRPTARVQWWDSTDVWVLCPFCDIIHRHGFSGDPTDYNKRHPRLSHCVRRIPRGLESQYEYSFPSCGAYEVDKSNALFVTAGADPSQYLAKHGTYISTPHYREEIMACPKWCDAIETIRISKDYTSKQLPCVVQDVIWGNVQAVREYLESSQEADFLAPEQEVNMTGRTALHMAACEQFPEMLELLLEKGANTNARDLEGRTPLAEAALWGRLENVQVLLRHGARQDFEYVRNGQQLQVIDFARYLEDNVEERYYRSGGSVQVYRENTHDRDLDRKAIVRLLNNGMSLQNDRSAILSGLFFTSPPQNEAMKRMIAHFDLPNKWKTIGVLYRNGNFPLVAAMSGWSHGTDYQGNIHVSGRDWTDKARRLCERVGFDPDPHIYDQGDPGRYHACHAEKQLIAYFVEKHWFPRLDGNELLHSLDLSFQQMSMEEMSQPESEGLLESRLARLQKVRPNDGLTSATIVVCRPRCNDCARFLERVNLSLGLNIRVLHRCVEPDCQLCSN
ncbi:uncharacterized protein B0I36DRAFT_254866 [Microdochium trichocladiopsis]|uniref:Single-strand DNA deaminase toxin A-like C-terminal domain-containing protein n=1 Tax=Microdochium trichocladiopsis TaxID=1682393 RepID=A0A9P8XSP4_9PEZI|nr:uncharacterized protein B0I36DRAFT_254866 [Microdochium trichocladiopsis]KAH7016036.1 hypothetical protein B0I36DRAFT_254866 [Microdochium trichocladiopsis]